MQAEGAPWAPLQGPGGSAPTEQEKAEVHSEVRPHTGELRKGRGEVPSGRG